MEINQEKKEPQKFWGIVELFGHSKCVGEVSEHQLAGTNFVRVDIPAAEDKPAFTRYFGGAAIYSITPCAESLARDLCARYGFRDAPIPIPDFRTAITQRNTGDGDI
jgi:hypothetical protein